MTTTEATFKMPEQGGIMDDKGTIIRVDTPGRYWDWDAEAEDGLQIQAYREHGKGCMVPAVVVTRHGAVIARRILGPGDQVWYAEGEGS